MSTHTTAPPTAEAIPGIVFDGRAYHYHQYSYDRLEDALNYAKLERAKPGFHEEPSATVHWKEWKGPTPEERVQMALYGITYEAGRYCYGPYRYDLLPDAMSYARRRPRLSMPGQGRTGTAGER